jgi:CubicO group peptidase (beta-lactamase class C family)
MLSPATGPAAFGHPGAGGSLGFADPEAGVAFGYVMNQMQLGLTGDRRTETLVAALYGCLR